MGNYDTKHQKDKKMIYLTSSKLDISVQKRDAIKKMNRPSTGWEEIFAIHIDKQDLNAVKNAYKSIIKR